MNEQDSKELVVIYKDGIIAKVWKETAERKINQGWKILQKKKAVKK